MYRTKVFALLCSHTKHMYKAASLLLNSQRNLFDMADSAFRVQKVCTYTWILGGGDSVVNPIFAHSLKNPPSDTMKPLKLLFGAAVQCREAVKCKHEQLLLIVQQQKEIFPKYVLP